MEASNKLDEYGLTAVYEPRKSNLAFIVEALVLLLFLVGSLAVITQLFALSANKANSSKHLEQAVIAAANAAERFSADPSNVEQTKMENGLAVTCSVNETALGYGTRYDVIITVFDESGEVYSLQTARYMPAKATKQTERLASGDTGAAENTGSAAQGGAQGEAQAVEVIE